MMDKNPPVDVLRDSNLKASVFRNQGEKGVFYSTTFARTYTDDQGQARDSHSFAGNELLRLSELARQAYNRSQKLRREERKPRDADRSERNEKRDLFEAERSQKKRGTRRPERGR